jgi:uncharacterized protein YbaA (DUF1428 family)
LKVFSWIVWPSKEARDEGNKKVMADPRTTGDMPFDMKRLIFGGFTPIFQTGSSEQAPRESATRELA